MVSLVYKYFLRLLFFAFLCGHLNACVTKGPVNGQQAGKTKKKGKEKPRPRPLPKIYRPKMMAEEPEEKTRKPSNDKGDSPNSSCDSDKPCK